MVYNMMMVMFFLLTYLSTWITANASIVSAVFAFGDSTIDSGNNNHLKGTLFQGNHMPYGQDFPGHIPTGRFSNGILATDYISQFLGIKHFLPAYLDPNLRDDDLLTGVSFGSAGSGLDDITVGLNRVLSMDEQLSYFKKGLSRIEGIVGVNKSKEIVEKALFVISVGTNDMVDNAYTLQTRVLEFGIGGYQDFLLQRLEGFIQKVYELGGRRILVAGLPPIGCLPLQMTVNTLKSTGEDVLRRGCNESQNSDSMLYNSKLQGFVQSLQLQAIHQPAEVAYFDIYSPIMDMLQNPPNYGFTEMSKGCCGTGVVELGPLCNELDVTCANPSQYVFWDAIHPTQAAYRYIADVALHTIIPFLTN